MDSDVSVMYEFQKENVFSAVLCLSPCCLLNTETYKNISSQISIPQ